MMSLVKLISKLPLFARFSMSEKRRIAGLNHIFIRYAKDEHIVNENERSDSFFIMIRGTARVTKNVAPNKVLAVIQPGQIFGEMAYLSTGVRLSNVVANETNVIAMRLDRRTLRHLTHDVREQIKDGLIQILVARINKMNDLILQRGQWSAPTEELTFDDVPDLFSGNIEELTQTLDASTIKTVKEIEQEQEINRRIEQAFGPETDQDDKEFTIKNF
ncbi:cyclic nucleotide-binding domain-containing protein [Magnetococcales bacterium HHB-1]